MTGRRVPQPIRDQVIDFVDVLSKKTEIPIERFIGWLGISKGKFFQWRLRYGKVNAHNAHIPRHFWLNDWERDAIVVFHQKNPLEGYRRLTFMMLDQDVVAVSPASVYRILRERNLLDRHSQGTSKKGSGFVQPTAIHQHWHTDVTYINIAGTFYYLCAVLDGYSRVIIHWEIRERMQTKDIETIIQRAKELSPDAHPRIISDNGPQFISSDFKAYIRLASMTHVLTSPFYPQSNGKIEAWHKTLKKTTIRPKCPRTLEEARFVVGEFVSYYNNYRLHSALGYVTPADKFAGREEQIWATRRAKIKQARQQRCEASRVDRV